MIYSKYTNIGPRNSNEDSFFIKKKEDGLYLCIADGVGGSKYGGFASEFVTENFGNYIDSTNDVDFIKFIETINEELIYETIKSYNSENVGTTFTAGKITKNKIEGVHIGDSRVCILRGNGIKQITKEHSEVARLIREGHLNPKDKSKYPRKNVIENVIGNSKLFKYDTFEFDLEPSDRIIFSTDGFHETISKKDIRDISIRFKSHNDFFKQIIVEIENRKLRDNTTFISIEI